MTKKKEDQKKTERKELPVVEFLESRTKLGFRTEIKDDHELFEPLFRLVCDDPDPDKDDPVICTPFCTAQALSTLVQGFIYLNPIIGQVMKKAHENAPAPEAEKEA